MQQGIANLKVLPHVVRQPKQVTQPLQLEQRLETNFRVRMLQVPIGALKFEVVVDKERVKAWCNVEMNVIALPLQVLNEYHQGITT